MDGFLVAGGWAKDGAVQEQIDASINDAVQRVREHLSVGESLMHCEDCGAEIPERRRQAKLGVRRCVPCQEEEDGVQAAERVLDRRGNKDSQLR